MRTATVVDNDDPLGEGRVMIEIAGERAGARQWARTATLMAGPDRGSWFIPDVDDEVLVAFERNDADRPVVIGSLWSAPSRPPEQVGADNGRRSFVTRSGAHIMIDDTRDRCVVELETGAGQRVRLDDGPPSEVTVTDADGNTIRLDAAGVTVTSSSKVSIAASLVSVSAANITFDTSMVAVSGVLKCDTLVADNVVASSYTPGAGNVM